MTADRQLNLLHRNAILAERENHDDQRIRSGAHALADKRLERKIPVRVVDVVDGVLDRDEVRPVPEQVLPAAHGAEPGVGRPDSGVDETAGRAVLNGVRNAAHIAAAGTRRRGSLGDRPADRPVDDRPPLRDHAAEPEQPLRAAGRNQSAAIKFIRKFDCIHLDRPR